MRPVITRFAPSPTGNLHLGGARTALFCYLFAKKKQGKFLLRIEDTDKKRSTATYTKNIVKALQWLKIQWDDEPIYQSQGMKKYMEAAGKLLNKGQAYRCTCTPEELVAMREEQMKSGAKNPRYDRRHRDTNLGPTTKNFVIRFKNPLTGEASFTDMVQGEVRAANDELDDMVLVRADGSPTYNFCAVVDDLAMGITHIIRGDDHLRNSLRQCNLYTALGRQPPKFAHLPMILNNTGRRLSKRDGADNILNYRDRGILSDALCSYMARLGWSAGDQEIFSRNELLDKFKLEDVQKSPASYDENKLLWMNNSFMKEMDDICLKDMMLDLIAENSILAESIKHNNPAITKAISIHKDRCDTLAGLADEIAFYSQRPARYDEDGLKKHLSPVLLMILTEFKDDLSRTDDWNAIFIKELIQTTIKKHNLKFPNLAMPLRLAITGGTNSPSIDLVLDALGKDESIKRIENLIEYYANTT